MAATYYIKCRVAGAKRACFYAAGRESGLSRLKIFANRFPEDKVDAAVKALRNLNPDCEFFKAAAV